MGSVYGLIRFALSLIRPVFGRHISGIESLLSGIPVIYGRYGNFIGGFRYGRGAV